MGSSKMMGRNIFCQYANEEAGGSSTQFHAAMISFSCHWGWWLCIVYQYPKNILNQSKHRVEGIIYIYIYMSSCGWIIYMYVCIHMNNCMYILFWHICHGQTTVYGLWPRTIIRDSLQWVNLIPMKMAWLASQHVYHWISDYSWEHISYSLRFWYEMIWIYMNKVTLNHHFQWF